jgi:hypothetical protein
MSFLRDYLAYATGNEAPEMFHVWSGYACLSAAISRRVWLPYGDEAIYPNLYVMLVGDAGNGKSFALRKAKRLLSELNNVPIARSVETPEGLWRFMGGDRSISPPIPSPVMFLAKWPDGQVREVHPMTIVANEFVNFITMNQAGWINALNDIYDEDKYEYRTKGKGEDNLIGPYIVFLGALTTEISSDLQKTRIIATGFARRTIFQYGERNWFDPHSIPGGSSEAEKELRRSAVAYAKVLQKTSGEFTWNEETQKWWKTWYDPHIAEIPNHTPQTKPWFASKHVQVLKLGLLTALSEGTKLELSIPHLEVALAYLAEMEKDLYKVFGGVGRNELAMVALKIYEYVANLREPISRQTLSTIFFSACKPPNDFNECLTYLINSGKLVETLILLKDKPATPLIATREVMNAFSARVTPPPQRVVIPPELRQDAQPSTDPPSAPPLVRVNSTPSVVIPTFVPPVVGTET